jgi:diadenosine tetraphosphate (Ap4A) HIT family hydrolase
LSEDTVQCPLCRAARSDAELERVEVWSDALWRLTVSLTAEVPGFAYLEPRRHIPDITALDGPEAETLGVVLAAVASALKEVTEAELVYVYVFGGGIPHLHLHLAPHHDSDALNANMIKGELVERRLPSGATDYVSEDYPPLPAATLLAVAARVRERLARAGATGRSPAGKDGERP